MPNDPQQAMEFAQSKGQARKEGRTNVRFADVAGISPILAELQDVVKVYITPSHNPPLACSAYPPPKGENFGVRRVWI